MLNYLYCVTFACLNFHRKFTEIEAANHQLASALFSVDTEPQRQIKSTDKDKSEKKLKKGKRFHIYIITVDLMVRISLAVARHWFIV